jgi:uncharacterized BrkB/YihY/UPF0761 family membrane protein
MIIYKKSGRVSFFTPRIESVKAFHTAIDFYWGRGIAYVAPALAFYLLLLLPSLLLGFAALGSLVFPEEISAERITPLVAANFAPEIRRPIENFSDSVFSAPALIVSLPLMVWTLSAVLSLLERVMSRSPSAPWDFIHGRIRLLGLSALIVLLLVVVLLAWSLVPGLVFLPLLFMSTLLLYRWLPRKRPSWREAFQGALPASVLLALVPRLFALYIDVSDPSLASGFVATLLLLLSSYGLSVALLVGAGIASRRTHLL